MQKPQLRISVYMEEKSQDVDKKADKPGQNMFLCLPVASPSAELDSEQSFISGGVEETPM